MPSSLPNSLWKPTVLVLSVAFFLAPVLHAQNLTVRSVALLGNAGQPQIEVKTSGPVSPATQAVTGPDRIVIDFPGALPADTLKKLAVHRGGLRGIRTGLFQSQPPITRVVLDVDGPMDYQVVPSGNTIVIKLGKLDGTAPVQAPAAPAMTAQIQRKPISTPPVKLAMAAPMPSPAAFRTARQLGSSIPALQVVNSVIASPLSARGVTDTTSITNPITNIPAPAPRPTLNVAVHSNLLSIRAQGATLAEVLYEVHRRTGADIAIPAGAEQERVVVNIPPAPGREVIASLLNGSRFNYIVLGTDNDPGGFRNLLLSVKEGAAGGSSGIFVHNTPPPSGVPPAMQAQAAPTAEPVADQSQMDPGGVTMTGPELEPIPEEAPAEPETSPETQRPVPPQQAPIQNIPDAGQVPQ